MLNSTSAATVAKMLFYFQCCSAERAVFVARAMELSTPALASVLQTLKSMHGGQQMPDQFAHLASSYMSRTFSNYSTSEGNSNHIVAVFAILLNNNDEEMLGSFVHSVCATKDANLLQALTKSCLTMPQNKHVRLLAAARAAQLRYPKQQPHANVPNHPQVTHFLRSDQTTMKYSSFYYTKRGSKSDCPYLSNHIHFQVVVVQNYSSELSPLVSFCSQLLFPDFHLSPSNYSQTLICLPLTSNTLYSLKSVQKL